MSLDSPYNCQCYHVKKKKKSIQVCPWNLVSLKTTVTEIQLLSRLCLQCATPSVPHIFACYSCYFILDPSPPPLPHIFLILLGCGHKITNLAKSCRLYSNVIWSCVWLYPDKVISKACLEDGFEV